MSNRPKVIKKLYTGPPPSLVGQRGSGAPPGKSTVLVNEIEEMEIKQEEDSIPPLGGFMELHTLISDSFLFMHEKLQGLEEVTTNAMERLDRVEKQRNADHKQLMHRLNEFERNLNYSQGPSNSSSFSIQKRPLKRPASDPDPVMDLLVEAPRVEAQSIPMRKKKRDYCLFPLKSTEAMERMAKDAAVNETLRKNLDDMFSLGRSDPMALRNWIADDVLQGYSITYGSSKQCIADSLFISMIQNAWINAGHYSTEDFEQDFVSALASIETDGGAKRKDGAIRVI